MTTYPASSSRGHATLARCTAARAMNLITAPAGGPPAVLAVGQMNAVARMRVARLIIAGMSLTALVALAGCASDAPTSATRAPDAPLSPPLWTLVINTSRDSIHVGESVTLILRATDAGGAEVAANIAASWITSDAGVATAESRGSRETTVMAMRPGIVTITATLQGRSVSRTLTILPSQDAAGSLVAVESFRVIEFQYSSVPGQLFYAAQIRLRATGNQDGAVAASMTFLIPGLRAVPSCKAVISVNSSVEMFIALYDDSQFRGAHAGVRATEGEATVIVTVTDGRGVSTEILARGPIVADRLPRTPSGSEVSPNFC